MTELVSDDSSVAEDVPSEAPEEESTAVDFGADLDGDTQDEATEAERGHSEESEVDSNPFNPDTVDWLRVDPNTLPDQYKPLASMAKNIQASYTQAQQQARALQEQAQQERQQYLQAIEQLKTSFQQPQQEQQNDPYAQVAQYLDEDERRGLEVVRTLQQQQMAPLMEQIEALQSQLQQAQQGNQQFQQYIQAQQQQARMGEIAETRAAYGAEVDNLTQQQMLAMKALVDQGASVKGAFESVTGKTSEQIVAARERDKAVRTQAKQKAHSSAARATTQGSRVSTDAELNSALKSLGFE